MEVGVKAGGDLAAVLQLHRQGGGGGGQTLLRGPPRAAGAEGGGARERADGGGSDWARTPVRLRLPQKKPLQFKTLHLSR